MIIFRQTPVGCLSTEDLLDTLVYYAQLLGNGPTPPLRRKFFALRTEAEKRMKGWETRVEKD